MLDRVYGFTAGWWNTGVHPIRGNTKADWKQVSPVLYKLLDYCEVLVLCEQELDSALCAVVSDYNGRPDVIADFDLQSLCRKENRCCFKMVLIWNKIRVQLQEKSLRTRFQIVSAVDNNNYRVGQRVILELDGLPIEMCLIHWAQHPAHRGEDMKTAAARCLYAEFLCKEPKFKLIAGDFNTEPYSKALAELNVSRSAQYAIQYKSLWNPFWALLSEEGTLNSPNDKELKCLFPLFDQILVSSNFLDRFDIQPRIIKEYKPPKGEHYPIVLHFIRKDADHECQ